MEIDKAKFKRLKNKVLKKFPKASTRTTVDGRFYVSDGEGNALTSDYMIPPQLNVAMAWFWLAETMKVDQNIQRTNPNRVEMMFDEKKFNRISRRNKHK
jgi:hypothetical protein